MRLKRNDKGEFEEVHETHVTPELLILSKLELIEEELQLIHKADYEARLKADMVAMLTEIQLEIEELKNEPACCQHYSEKIIQQKINALRGEDT